MTNKKETIKKLVKRLNKSTLSVKKRGNKYCVKDTVEHDGNYGCMSAKKLRKEFG